MSQRAVLPVYDDSGEWAVGFTGRSWWPECPKCKGYHHPAQKDCLGGPVNPKWRHSENFPKEFFLFGWWLIAGKSPSRVILVESPGNVLRLHEAGITECAGMMGSSLCDPQRILLETSGATDIILAFDNDETGKVGATKAQAKLKRLFNTKIIRPPDGYKDWAEMPPKEVERCLRC